MISWCAVRTNLKTKGKRQATNTKLKDKDQKTWD